VPHLCEMVRVHECRRGPMRYSESGIRAVVILLAGRGTAVSVISGYQLSDVALRLAGLEAAEGFENRRAAVGGEGLDR